MKRTIMKSIALVLMLVFATSVLGGCSREWPAKAFEHVSTSSAGGGNDLFSRTVAQGVAEATDFPQPFNVINKVGGSNEVAYQYIKDSADDYKVVSTSSGEVRAWCLRESEHSPDDFKTVCILANDVYLLVVPADAPYDSIEELIAYSQESSSTLKFATAGRGGPDWFGWYYMKELGLNADYVPSDGAGASLLSVVSGDCDLTWSVPATAWPHVESGALKALAVSASERLEWEGLKDIPTSTELGYPTLSEPAISQWRGIMAPANMPDEHVEVLLETYKELYESDWWKENYLNKNMLTAKWAGPEEMMEIMLEVEAETKEMVAAGLMD